MDAAMDLDERAVARFERWFESVAKPAVAFEKTFTEMLLAVEFSRSTGGALLYELRPHDTMSHLPEHFMVDPEEVVVGIATAA